MCPVLELYAFKAEIFCLPVLNQVNFIVNKMPLNFLLQSRLVAYSNGRLFDNRLLNDSVFSIFGMVELLLIIVDSYFINIA